MENLLYFILYVSIEMYYSLQINHVYYSVLSDKIQ